MTGSSGFGTYTRPPTPREPLKGRGRPKLDLRRVEHVRYGHGKVLAIRQIDGSGEFMADVRFADGTVRTIHLQQAFWVNDISALIPEPPKLRSAPVKAVRQPVEEIGPSGVDAPELEIAA